MGATCICCHGNQSSDPILIKTYLSLSPTHIKLQIKFHSNRPTGCRDIQFETVKGRTHSRVHTRTPAQVSQNLGKSAYSISTKLN